MKRVLCSMAQCEDTSERQCAYLTFLLLCIIFSKNVTLYFLRFYLLHDNIGGNVTVNFMLRDFRVHSPRVIFVL